MTKNEARIWAKRLTERGAKTVNYQPLAFPGIDNYHYLRVTLPNRKHSTFIYTVEGAKKAMIELLKG